MQNSTSVGQALPDQSLSFIDSINQRSYRLIKGKLHSQQFRSLETEQIQLNLSTEAAQNRPPQGLTVVSGEVVANTDRTIISADGEVSILRSAFQICDGSRWEWYAPLSLQGVHLGICKIQQSGVHVYQLFEFNSSTSRTVSFVVEGDQLRVWVNGNKPSKVHSKTITYDSVKNKWYPCVKLEQKGNTIIYLPFSTLAPSSGSSIYNPFGKLYLNEPAQLGTQCPQLPSVQLKRIFQLSNDRLLLVWSNNAVRILTRNSQTLQFEFSPFAVHNNHTFNLFTLTEYDILKDWRGDKSLFGFSKSIALLQIHEWIKYLISVLDHESSARLNVYKLLLTKLALIRPYLCNREVKIANLIGSSDFDVQNYRRVFKYFNVPSYQFVLTPSILTSNTQWKIQGDILDVTQNYLVTRHQKNVILYNLQDTVQQVFRESLEKGISFSKKALIQNFQQGDIRSLKSEEFFLYKILTNCLHKEKKKDQAHTINENEVKQLTRDYGISETDARTALQKTGHLEDALVWIYSDKKQLLKVESQKEIEEQKIELISIVELSNMFARLILQVGNKLFILGILPSQIKNWLYKSEKEYVDLVTLKHEQKLENINWKNWYSEGRHPKLSILDDFQTSLFPQCLFKQGEQVYYLTEAEGTLQQKQILFNKELLFDHQQSIREQQTTNDFSFKFKDSTYKNSKGEMVLKSSQNNSNKDQSDSHLNKLIKFTLQSKFAILNVPSDSERQQWIPLIVESGPPGCNNNYSISSILQPNCSFLANYPHQIVLRHLHNKLINVSSIKLHRSIHRRNMNEISEGTVYFRNQQNKSSKHYTFSFQDKQQQIQIPIRENQYWKYVVIVPKFVQVKKLPFEIGFIALRGTSLSKDAYQQIYFKAIYQLLASKTISISTIEPISDVSALVWIHESSGYDMEELQLNTNITVINRGIIVKQQANDRPIQSVDAKTLINYLIPTSTKRENVLRKISRSNNFDFTGFSEAQAYKFVDLVLFYTGSIESEQYFLNMFNKMWQNQWAKKYIMNFVSNITETPTIPLPYLKLIIKQLSNQQHINALSSIAKALPLHRSKQYESLNDTKNGYLLLQNQFYSDYYFNLVEPKAEEKVPFFNEPLIQAEIAVFKNQLTRRLLIKLPSAHCITDVALRIERCDTPCKMNYSVFAISKSGKVAIGEGRILQHQWAQITKLSHKPQVEAFFGINSRYLNVYGLQVQTAIAQYLQIELSFTETGIVNHILQSGRVPQIDIIPQLYGYATGQNEALPFIQNLFTFNPEQMFFLSVSTMGTLSLQKYSVSKDRQVEYLYFKSQREQLNSLQNCIDQKIKKNDYQSLIGLQRRFFKNIQKYSLKVCLDYLYTLMVLTLNELETRSIKLDDDICEILFKSVVQVATGPAKLITFKALSHKVILLIKSLQYIEADLSSLGKVQFGYDQLLAEVDLSNGELCKSLTRLILRGVAYEQKWTQLLIKMCHCTQAHQQIFTYFTNHQDWLNNQTILEYIASLSDELFLNNLVPLLSYAQLCKLVLSPSSKPRLQTLLQIIVEKGSQLNPIDLDVVSLIFQHEQIKWQQLQKVIGFCPQAMDTIIHQFLQSDNPVALASQNNALLVTAASLKYAQQFAVFLEKIFDQDKKALRDVFLSIIGKCNTLHYDFLETIASFIFSSCNLGGVEGVRLVGEEGLAYLQAAVEMLKVTQRLPEGAELPNEELFIEWYLNNNDYELIGGNPANKTPGYHMMRQLVELILQRLKTTNPTKVLSKYSTVLQKIKASRRVSLATRHIAYNQLHHGTTQLLQSSLTSGSLAEVLIGTNPLLATVINELKSSLLKNQRKKGVWNAKQVDITQKFTLKNVAQQVKDIQGGKSGTKIPILKLPITQKSVILSSQQSQWPSKFIVGFVMNDHLENKNAILPKKVELFGGNAQSFTKIGDLQLIQDQFYLSLGIRLFGLNLNSFSWMGSNAIKSLQIRLHESLLTAASEVLENGQKSKKGATYNISFINVSGFDLQPTQQPDYSQLYITLLGFLGQSKYREDLKKVAASQQFDQKLELIIQVLNDLLPNPQIEQLLLAFNKEGENVLQHILRSKGANPHLVNLLMLGRLTKDNLNKLISYTLDNLAAEYVNIVTLTLRLANYNESNNASAKTIAGLSNITQLLERYEQSEGEKKHLQSIIITSLLTVSNIYQYDIGKLINLIWNKPARKQLYPILAAILPYYPQELENIALNGNCLIILQELTSIMSSNKTADSVLKQPYNELYFLCTLISNNNCREAILSQKAPITIVELLRSQKSLLLKYSSESMKLFISLFQGTCIGSIWQDDFSEIIISMMTSLNDFEAMHHQYFIQHFFFPLINAFKGVPLFFVWKDQSSYIWQPTQILKTKPIKSSSKIVTYSSKYYSPIVQLDQNYLNNNIIILQKSTNQILYQINKQRSIQVQSNLLISHSIKQNKLIVELGSNLIILPNQKYQIYEESRWQQNLLTNITLTNLQNPWILQQKYRSILPIRQSSSERCYFLPQQMTISELLKHINISGLRIHSQDLQSLKIKNVAATQLVSHETKLKDILTQQKLQFIKLQIEASQIFKSTTIETLANDQSTMPAFVAQQTIFRAFQQKKGLQKLITVLTGCVKNWTNSEQSNIWGQFLKQLESYSCFPVFSSLYMTKQSNVSLLFDLLLGLPDKQDSKKWQQKQKESVRQLYAIIKDVFAVEGQQAIIVRNYALKSGFYSTMLNRLHLITKQPKRHRVDQPEQEDEIVPTLEKKSSQEEYKAKTQKKKGVGYGTDSSTNQKWDVTGQQQARKQQFQQILGLLKILERFLDYKDFEFPQQILEQTLESSLLPIIESSLRGGSLLQISKYADLFQGELSFIQVLAKCKRLIPTLMPVSKNYQPKQPESLHSLLKTLQNTSSIFTSCLTGSASEKVSEQIARKIISTFQIVEDAVSGYATSQNDEQQQKKILQLPLAKKYPILMKDLRFDYIDMKDNNSKISKHHYASYYLPGHKPPVQKTIRLAQQLADVSHALPIDHTNAIFVRCDKERVDYMQALIMGSNGTPYGHGAYLFDIYFEDTYPNGPPKVNLTTTGSGQIRFNPNLYACGKVCLSLLGTWRGNAMQNWDAKVSTLLQVLVSIQSIIMSEDIYFNEPGFEHEQGTVEGEKKNEAYANIVRYGNIKFAMLQNIKNPPKGFQTIIRRHFYLKKEEILEECQRWLKLADKRQASYNGLVSDHNHNWCNTFKKSKGQYKTMMEKAIKELEIQINKLPPPTNDDLKKQNSPAKLKKKQTLVQKSKQQATFEEIDVSYGDTHQAHVEMDINDEKVKDRWSRYIGAMGIQAVSKQSKASILLLGLGGLGVEIAKNLVLSGCRQLALCDSKQVEWSDLSAQFFLGQSDIGKNRVESSIYKLQELNHYVKVTTFAYDLANMYKFQVIVATEQNRQQLIKIDQFCREKGIKFLAVDCYGPYGQIFNDFGNKFQILDSNGQETTEVLIDEITVAEKGIVKVSQGQRHPFQDGETIQLSGVKGMNSLSNESQSINGSLHKIEVINKSSFYIGNTLDYSPYKGDGVARNIKTPKYLDFESLAQSTIDKNIDKNLQDYDFCKMGNLKLLHFAFSALSEFGNSQKRLPLSWNKEDASQFVSLIKQKKGELSQAQIQYLNMFSYTCSGTFGSVCAFFGGLASQEIFKAITGKYTPINQYFFADFSEVVEAPPKDQALWDGFVEERKPIKDRKEGIRRIMGNKLIQKLQCMNVFMIGSGAIGCELLKNFAMLQIGANESGKGSIVITDPDHIETSNLNRQFLFRQKHLRKPKSATAAAAVTQMNPRLKGHIKARLDKVCEATKDIYSNEFFQKLTIVTNALDNVEARRYVDSRCVDCKTALLQSGTLSSKGHVQVIIPYQTQTYGNKQDPNDANGDIPHCTLKMFPEETLHCIEWARDFFGKQFTLAPKALAKLLEMKQNYIPVSSDIEMLKDCLKTLQRRPANFEQAIDIAAKLFYQTFRNDVMQLLYTYPLDAITKDGKPFWKLPKRPPTPIQNIIPENPLHSTFIASYAVLLSKIYQIPYPKDFRQSNKRQEIARTASSYKAEPFVPSDKTAKQMTEQVSSEMQKQNQQKQGGQVSTEEGQVELYEKFKSAITLLKEGGESVECRAEQFEKDEDQNGHIDLIYSMANLRSCNYKLDEMDWINVKLKAGRIMPALSTTTSCIAALQTIQLVKYIKGCSVEQMRNAFLNLAVPMFRLGEPGPVQKIKVHDNLVTNIWERWTIGPLARNTTLGALLTTVQQKYNIIVKGLTLLEGGQIYSDIVLGLQSKKAQKQKLLSKSVKDILSEQIEQEQLTGFVDFTLVMAVGEDLIKHAPTLRLLFDA